MLRNIMGEGRGTTARRAALLMASKGLATPEYRAVLAEQYGPEANDIVPHLGPVDPNDAANYELIEQVSGGAFEMLSVRPPAGDLIDRLMRALAGTVAGNLSRSKTNEPPEYFIGSMLTDSVASLMGSPPELPEPEVWSDAVGLPCAVPHELVEVAVSPGVVPLPRLTAALAASAGLRGLARVAMALSGAFGDLLGEDRSMTQDERDMACALLAPAFLAFIGINPARMAVSAALGMEVPKIPARPETSLPE
jgi:hypothetical protein